MSENHEASDGDEDDDGLVSTGKIADSPSIIARNFDSDLRDKFEFYSYRNAADILASSFPEQFSDILSALRNMDITKEMIRRPGGSKGPIAKHVDTLFSDDWIETRITADLHVKLLHAKRTKDNPILREYSREGYLDGHRIDFVRGRVALDLEWNSKDQTYDRDLYAFSAFYDAGAIDVGVIITRGFSLDNGFFRSLGKVLKKDDTEGAEEVYKKFGASTTWMGKLLYRLDAGRNGGCPVLAIGITPNCVR
ncbi:BglII/BstYI family type II restriction endonuclease [Thalassovita aquimarina]|uniref:BglII/BstYI family type II restriction endonuclease n=1 Tax=Thalassovita aquimarina TaxID=2785917 RepID=UPI001BAFAFC7|nr:BglII/BstYI family type II restriction endonuclease [Thalassovita aquimarina]